MKVNLTKEKKMTASTNYFNMIMHMSPKCVDQIKMSKLDLVISRATASTHHHTQAPMILQKIPYTDISETVNISIPDEVFGFISKTTNVLTDKVTSSAKRPIKFGDTLIVDGTNNTAKLIEPEIQRPSDHFTIKNIGNATTVGYSMRSGNKIVSACAIPVMGHCTVQLKPLDTFMLHFTNDSTHEEGRVLSSLSSAAVLIDFPDTSTTREFSYSFDCGLWTKAPLEVSPNHLTNGWLTNHFPRVSAEVNKVAHVVHEAAELAPEAIKKAKEIANSPLVKKYVPKVSSFLEEHESQIGTALTTAAAIV